MSRKLNATKTPKLPFSRKVTTLLVALVVLIVVVAYAITMTGSRIYVDTNNQYQIKISNSQRVNEVSQGVHINNKLGGGLVLEIVERDTGMRQSTLFSQDTQDSIRKSYSKGYKIDLNEVTFGSAILAGHSALVVHFTDKTDKNNVANYTQYYILRGQKLFILTINDKSDKSILRDFRFR